jgi:hypothetical protein
MTLGIPGELVSQNIEFEPRHIDSTPLRLYTVPSRFRRDYTISHLLRVICFYSRYYILSQSTKYGVNNEVSCLILQ